MVEKNAWIHLVGLRSGNVFLSSSEGLMNRSRVVPLQDMALSIKISETHEIITKRLNEHTVRLPSPFPPTLIP